MENRIRELRESFHLTQKELGTLVGVSRQAINAIEMGKYEPSIRLAFRLSKFFNVTVEELFYFYQEEPKWQFLENQ